MHRTAGIWDIPRLNGAIRSSFMDTLRWPRLVLAASVAWLAAAPAHAGVEFVTQAGNCTKVDEIGDGKDLNIQAGNNVRFEVWGSGIDSNPDVTVWPDNSPIKARIVSSSARNGFQNLAGPCRYNTGSVLVEVDSPGNTTTNIQGTLRFRMPAGDRSPLQVTVRAFRGISWVWAGDASGVVQNPANCLSGSSGSIVKDLNNERIVINLPVGAATNTSNCTVTFYSRISPNEQVTLDVGRTWTYPVSIPPALQPLLSVQGDTNTVSDMNKNALVRLNGNALALRQVTQPINAVLSASTPNSRTDTVQLVVNPAPPNGFTQPVACVPGINFFSTPNSTSCEVRIAVAPPPAGQRLTFQVASPACIEPSNPASYDASTGVGHYMLPPPAVIHQVGFKRATNAPAGCAANSPGAPHTVKFWIGARGDEAGPLYSAATIRIVAQ